MVEIANPAAATIIPANAILLVRTVAVEREWVAAGKFAGYIAADSYFSNTGQP